MSAVADALAEGGASRYVDTEGVYARVAERLGRASQWALSPHDAGLGNETLFLLWGSRRFVLRRPPLPRWARAGHGVLREARVLADLDWTDLPTARPLFACADEDVAGTPFTVQQRVDGHVLRHGEPVDYAAGEHRRRVGEAFVDTLAEIHEVDTGEFETTPERPALATRVAALRDRFTRHTAHTDREVPGVAELAAELLDRVPEPGERTLVHGDYTLANLVFSSGTPPEVTAVLDWERAGVGDPLVDLGYALAFWFADADERCGVPPSVLPGFTVRGGFPNRGTLLARYEERTGRSFDHDRFYRALALFETAVTFEGYYRRHLAGASGRSVFADLGAAVPRVVDRAEGVLDGAEPL